MRAPVATVLIVLLAGCGARTTLDPGPGADEDAGQTLDAGRDAGRDGGRDAGRDAGPELPCGSDADCVQGVCRARRSFPPSDLAPLPLTCGEPDAGAAVAAPCGEREECDRGLCALAGACVMPCTSDADCGGGERCQTVYVRTGRAAMQPLEACVAWVAAAPDVRVTGPEPGPRIPAFGEVEDPLPGLGSNALVVWTTSGGAIPFIQRIRTRGSPPTSVFDAFAVDRLGPAPAWGVNPTTITELATLLYPNGPNTPSSPEGFAVSLGSLTGVEGASQRVVLQRDGEGSVLDIDAYLVGGGRWTSTGGSVPSELRMALTQARAILEQVGIDIGEIRVHEVVGGLRRRFEILDGSNPLGVPEDLPELYMLSAGARLPSVHVFFVRTIDGALGIASGIPGPHGLPGTRASGVAIATDVVPSRRLPEVIVHEIGHFTGLFHTSELDGAINDPLPDTPECRADRDADGDGWLLPDECVGAGADHIMFWAGQGRVLSPQQGEIMRRSYFVR